MTADPADSIWCRPAAPAPKASIARDEDAFRTAALRASRGRYRVPYVVPVDPVQTESCAVDQEAPEVGGPSLARGGADVHQARLFIELLETELAELESHLTAIESRMRVGRPAAQQHLVALRARHREVVRLRDALVFRFPTA